MGGFCAGRVKYKSMKTITKFFILFLALNVNLLWAQNEKIKKTEKSNNTKAENILSKKIDGGLEFDELVDLYVIYRDSGNFDMALKYSEKAFEIVKQKNKNTDDEYLLMLGVLLKSYFDAGYYGETENLCEKEVKNIDSIKVESNLFYHLVLCNCGLSSQSSGKYEKAISIFEKCLKLYEKYPPQDSMVYAFLLNNMAMAYSYLGQNENGIESCIKGIQILERIGKESEPIYGYLLNAQAVCYRVNGQYKEAFVLLEKSISHAEKTHGKNHPDYAIRLSNLADLYQILGNYEKAINLYETAIDLSVRNFGKNNPILSAFYNGAALAYQNTGRYESAFEYLLKALEIRKLTLGENHLEYIITLSNMGQLVVNLKLYEEGLGYLQNAKHLLEINSYQHNLMYATVLGNIAMAKGNLGIFDKENEAYLKKAIQIIEESKGRKNPDYLTESMNLILLYQQVNEFEKSIQLIDEIDTLLKQFLSEQLFFLGEKEVFALVDDWEHYFEQFQSITYKNRKSNSELKSLSYNDMLFLKNLILSNSTKVIQTIYQSNEEKVITLFEEWKKIKTVIITQKGLETEHIELRYLESRADSIEHELVKFSNIFNEKDKFNKFTLKEIQNRLNLNETTIEFAEFTYYDKNWTDSTVYAALLLKKNAEHPEFIFQFEEKQLNEIFSQNKTEELNQLYSSSSDSNDLYQLIWQPLEPYLKGGDIIYFSPSGILHSIDLQAILAPDGKRLGEKYNMVQMSTTRNVVTTSGEPDKSSIALFGGIDYDFKPAGKDTIQNPDYDFHKPELTAENRGGTEYFPPLEGTKKEIEQIQQQFANNKSQTTLITGAQATEEAFKSLSGKSPKILHISTHGFFFPDVKKNKEDKRMVSFEEDKSVFKISENPLLRSGLIMAHGNYVWQKGSNPYEKEDGILTAYEIANLNLSNTDLVVLSACETGLGEIKGSEGVFGLQRAFKMAGVDYLMMSLWKVPDKETKEFMQLFYSNWLGGMKIRDAFRNTQLTMSKAYPNDPYKWAAFVLVE